MPNYNERKRLKKKMLDRWENEGGRIAGESASSHESHSASDRRKESTLASAPRNKSTIGATPRSKPHRAR